MIIIGNMVYPLESSQEAGKRFLEAPALSDFLTMRGPFIRGLKGEGVETIVVYEFDNAKMAEAMVEITNRYVRYQGVPGLSYSINVWMEAPEALKMIGLV